MRIKSARLMRATERNGRTTAEVEFALEPGTLAEEEGASRYVAILEREGDRPYVLSKVMRNEADYELDWYENPEHTAYTDVTKFFADAANPAQWVEQLLNTGDVAQDMKGGD